MHPMGQALGYAGKGEVKVIGLDNETLYTKGRDLNNRTHHFCAMSPNGLHFAVLSKAHGCYYLEILLFDITLMKSSLQPYQCHKLSKGFEGNRYHNDHAECKWSPDGSHIALSSSMGKLFLVTRLGMDNVYDVCPDIVDSDLCTAGAYDFDPRSPFSVLAVGTVDHMLSIVNIVGEENGNPVVAQIETEEKMDCVQYNQDGSAVAVSFRSFVVKLYNTSDLTELHSVCLSAVCAGHVSRFANSAYPTIMRLSFSYDGRYLATSSCDGYVRVWAVPKLLSLQECCRKAILSCVPVRKIRTCSLPQKIKTFLLSEYF